MPNQNAPSVGVEKVITLSNLPSGSGLAVDKAGIFVVGDDAPYLFRLNEAYSITHKYLLLEQYAQQERIPKQQKPDFESMAQVYWGGQPSLLILGSGSKSPERDSLLIVPLAQMEQPQRFSVTALYDLICQEENISREELNIEGAVLTQDDLLLFNRGRNSIISLNWMAVGEYLLQYTDSTKPQQQLPLNGEQFNMRIYPIQLPEIGENTARFSGACTIPGTTKVLFTASVEDTPNWIDDGEILGSFIGLLDEGELTQQLPPHTWLIKNRDGETLKEKLESIDVLKMTDDGLEALAVTDNDDGTSKLLVLQLTGFHNLINSTKK